MVGNTKFGRNYILTVQLQAGIPLVIQPPFTIEFDIHRNILSSASTGQIRVYNLNKINRDQIEFNIYNQGSFRSIQLQAGYGSGDGSNLPVIFFGNISQAWSVREGVNFITQIECFDGGYAYNNAQTNANFPQGTPNQVVIEALLTSLSPYFVNPGAVGSFDGVTNRGKSYSGPTTALLTQLTGGGFFIDNSIGHCLGNDECLAGTFPLIDASTGLLGTPVREQQILTFDMIFEPRVQPAQIINLQAATLGNSNQTQAINGFYKVTSIRHRGMISGSVCGEAVTTLGMYLGQNGPDGLTVVS